MVTPGCTLRSLSSKARDIASIGDSVSNIRCTAPLPAPIQNQPRSLAEPGASWTDADSFFKASGGCATALVALPIRYMHTTVEMTDLRDMERIAELFAAFVLSLKKGEKIKAVIK